MRTLLLSTLLIASSTMSTAQNSGGRQRTATLSAGVHRGDPMGEFGQTWGKEFLGLGGQLAVPMRRLPFDMGIGLAWSHLGGKTATVPIAVDNYPDIEGDLSVNCNLYAVHPFLRFRPLTGRVMPYVDGLAGWRTFTTRSKLRAESSSGPLSNTRNRTDFAASWGWAAGVMVNLTGQLYAEGRFEKLRGGEVTYVDPSTIAVDGSGHVTYGELRSTTDAWLLQLGLTLRF